MKPKNECCYVECDNTGDVINTEGPSGVNVKEMEEVCQSTASREVITIAHGTGFRKAFFTILYT